VRQFENGGLVLAVMAKEGVIALDHRPLWQKTIWTLLPDRGWAGSASIMGRGELVSKKIRGFGARAGRMRESIEAADGLNRAADVIEEALATRIERPSARCSSPMTVRGGRSCPSFAAFAGWPIIWIPALLAPTGLFLHLVSIRQSLARMTTSRQKDQRSLLTTGTLTSIGATKC
jgi:hypothetical protein